MSDLTQVFESEESAEVEVQESEEVKETPTDEKPDTSAKDAETEDTGETDGSPPSEDQADRQIPLAAHIKERDTLKGQLREQKTELDYYKGEFESLKQKFEEFSKQPAPDRDEDPEGYAEYIQGEAEKEKTKAMQAAENKLILASEKLVSRQYDDYEDKKQHFVSMAKKDPHLGVAMRQSDNPALFAYETAKRDLFLEEIGTDPEAYKQRIIAEHLKSQSPEEADEDDDVPSLASTTAATVNKKAPKANPVEEVFADAPLS